MSRNHRSVAVATVLFMVAGLLALAVGPTEAVTDTTAPNLTEFSITPDTIDTSAAARTITVTARITDDVSGVGSSYGTYVTFSAPSGFRSVQASFDSSKRTSGSAQDGVYSTTLVLPRWSEQGTWRITGASLNDASGHSKYLSSADFTTAGFPASFVQSALGDSTPPVLASISISPDTIDTSSAARTVTVTARITDDVSGLPGGTCCASNYVTLASPSGNRSFQVSFDGSKRISGTAQDGVYRGTLTIARDSEQGTWRLTSGSLTDVAANYRSLSAADISSAGSPSSFQQTGIGDATPPVLVDFSFTPGTLDTSAAPATISINARITDDVSGFAPPYSYNPFVTFSSPSGVRSIQATLDSSKRISGTAQDGTYQTTIVVPRYSEQGTWRIASASLSDVAGNSKSISVADLADADFPTLFDQTGVGDATPPVLAGFSFTPSTIDTGASSRTVTVTAHITDDVSGISNPTGCCGYPGTSQVTFRAPSGNRSVSASFDNSKRISGTALDGVYRSSLALPRYAEMGTWRLASASLVDMAGNSASLSTSDFVTAGFPTALEQTAVGDGTPPTLVGFGLTPDTVDTSTSSQTITIRAHITDDLSGLGPNGPFFYFTSPALGQGTTIAADGVRLVSGTAQDGVYDVDVVVPRFAEGGTWQLNPVYLSDALGNNRNVAVADVAAAGFPTTFVVSARTPGSPTGVSASPGAGSATVSWTAPAPDAALPVTAYTVTAFRGATAAQTKTVAAPATSTTVAGLNNGSPYTFTVMASNASGTGAPSSPSSAVTPLTVPNAPTGVVASAGSGSASLSWSMPADDGGSPITASTVTADTGTAVLQTTTLAAPATSATVGGLANGQTYTFSVAVTNAAGTGLATTSNAVTPAAPVDRPVAAVPPVTAGSGYWMVGSDGGVYAFGDAPQLGAPGGILGSSEVVDLEPNPSGNGYWIVDDGGKVYAYGGAAPLGNADPARLVTGEKVISLSSTRSGHGYWIFTTRGRVLPVGDAVFYGDMSAVHLNSPVIDSIPSASGNGYYMVASDGGIFSFGDAKFSGSMGGRHLNAPVQSLVPDGDNVGYWLVASDGGIFAFDAPFKGSLGSLKLNKPITGMVRYGEGYLMVAEDGGVFDFSGSPNGFKGSLGGTPPSRPIVSVAALGG